MKLEIEIKDNKIFAPLKDKWIVATPEEVVRQKYICRLIDTYGFSLEQMEQELLVSNTSRGKGGARADIVVYKNKEDKIKQRHSQIIVECKADNINIHRDDYFQGANYAAMAGADFFVTTNLKETKVFKVIKGEIPKALDEIIDIPDAKSLNDDKKVKELLTQTKAFTREEFTKLLTKCHNIIRNNDKLSPEAAFDEISKILFVKIRYERSNDGGQLFSLKQFQKDKEAYERYKSAGSIPFYQQLFENTKDDFKDDDLFASNEIIRIRENSFEAIVAELQKYNLSTTSDDIKGIAFEQFLGKTFRGELGQFFTPRTVVNFMIDVLDPQEGETICDPCCGSGGFLIKAFEYVREKIENEIHQEKERIKLIYYTEDYAKLPEKKKLAIDDKVNDLFSKLNYELDINNKDSRLRKLSYDCIYGTDANPRMSRTAKMNMIMHGDGHGGVHHNDGLLNVNGIFENRFDVILTNPPFGSRVEKSLIITEADKFTDQDRIKKYKQRYGKAYEDAMRQVTDNIGKSLLDLYQVNSTLTEVLFIERCLNLLRPGGRMGIVLPEGVLNNTNLQKVRDFVESKAKIILITSIPQDVFIASGATVKPSLLFFKKFTEEETKEWNKIETKARKEVAKKYDGELLKEKQLLEETQKLFNKLSKDLKDINKLKGTKKGNVKTDKANYDKLVNDVEVTKAKVAEIKKGIKTLEKELLPKIEEEVRAIVKKEFDYEIPIAEVEKAGITTTGAACENELEPLAKEFYDYRTKNKLWKSIIEKIEYEIMDDTKLFRMIAGEPQEIYG